jgi:hypothetical protein
MPFPTFHSEGNKYSFTANSQRVPLTVIIKPATTLLLAGLPVQSREPEFSSGSGSPDSSHYIWFVLLPIDIEKRKTAYKTCVL